MGIVRFVKKLFKKNYEWPTVDFEEIKKRSRLLVIDDKDFPYLSLFKKEGYLMDKWSDIKELTKLEKSFYDIILLDIQGVGTQISAEQGLGVLKHLKKVSPTQMILAYSDAEWSLKYQEFFDLADSKLPKSADYGDFKRIIDQFLKRRFTLEYYVEKIHEVSKLSADDYLDLEANARKAIFKASSDDLRSYLHSKSDDLETIKKVLSYVDLAIATAKIIKNFT